MKPEKGGMVKVQNLLAKNKLESVKYVAKVRMGLNSE
jgi:hypothetical protein